MPGQSSGDSGSPQGSQLPELDRDCLSLTYVDVGSSCLRQTSTHLAKSIRLLCTISFGSELL